MYLGDIKMKGGRCKFGLLTFFLSMLLIPDFVHSRSYPTFTSKRFGNAGPPRLPALAPFMYAASDLPADYELTDYGDNYIPYEQVDDESEYYPLSPVYGYAVDQTGDDSFIDFEGAGIGKRGYPVARDIWSDGGDEKDEDVDLMRNAVISEMDQEPRESDAGIVYSKPVLFAPDNGRREREQTWYYGVPVYEERGRMRSRKDDSLRELGAITRNMEAEGDDNPRKFGAITRDMEGEGDDSPRKLGATNRNMVGRKDDEPMVFELDPEYDIATYWEQWQKRTSRSGRKNGIPLRKALKMSQKRFYAPEKSTYKTETSQNGNGKAMEANGRNRIEATTSAPRPKTPPTGQKEYVLNRPASPARKPVQRGIYAVNGKKTDAYDAIKKLIAMEGGVEKENRPRIQKRFVLSEDQLTSQLNGLKRISV